LIGDPSAFVTVPKNKEGKKNVLVVGNSSNNSHVQSVKTLRNVDIFVSRLHPSTTDNELIDSVQSVKDN